jgi:hypothetical protein
MLRPGFLEHRDYRYLKLSSALATVAILLYWVTAPAGGVPYGGTWFGYLLGIAALMLVLVHAWYGIRKRRTPRVAERRKGDRRKQVITEESDTTVRRSNDRRLLRAEDSWRFGSTLRGWLSAHVYMGGLLLILATLHSGFHFAWNVHTLAYILLLLVIASGIYGTFAYLHYPRLIAGNIDTDNLEDLLLKISEIDEIARVRALGLPDDINALVTRSRLNTRIGGNLFRQLRSRQRNCPTDQAVEKIQELGKKLVEGNQPRLLRDLYSVLLQKQRLVIKARREVCLNARMHFWLYIHGPLTIALLAALFAHVAAIFVYW